MPDGLACFHCGRVYPRGVARCARCIKPLPACVNGRFRLCRALAVNEETITYAALDVSEHARVVVRILRGPAGQAAKDRLLTESRVQRRFAAAGVCPDFTAAGELAVLGTFFTAAGFVDGVTFYEAMRKAAPAQVADGFIQLLAAVEPAHRGGVVLCNLAPRHVRITPEGAARLVDLRCAREPGMPSHGLGCEGFRAPEQFYKNEPVSKATDVFALGGLLYFALTGRAPYARRWSSAPAFDQPLAPPSAVNRVVTPGLDSFVQRALEIEPARRFPDASAMRDAFWREFAGRTQIAVPPKGRRFGLY